MKKLLFLPLLFVLVKNVEAQNNRYTSSPSSFSLDTLFTAINSREDVINITVSNPGEAPRKFIAEIVAVEGENSDWAIVYSAIINQDSYFLKQWRDGKKLTEKRNIRFVLPHYNKLYLNIDADEAKDFSFKINGQPIQNGMSVRLRVTALDNNEVAYSPIFYIYKQPS
ncbi:MAG: hypothetical protein QM802_10660 [Agriterribacter sp.]